jgi:hypothetical protein
VDNIKFFNPHCKGLSVTKRWQQFASIFRAIASWLAETGDFNSKYILGN